MRSMRDQLKGLGFKPVEKPLIIKKREASNMPKISQMHQWIKDDGFPAPQVGEPWDMALGKIVDYIEYLRAKKQ